MLFGRYNVTSILDTDTSKYNHPLILFKRQNNPTQCIFPQTCFSPKFFKAIFIFKISIHKCRHSFLSKGIPSSHLSRFLQKIQSSLPRCTSSYSSLILINLLVNFQLHNTNKPFLKVESSILQL